MALEYTSNPLVWLPANSSWTSITPDGGNRVASNWFQVSAAVPNDAVLAGIAIGTWFVSGGTFPYDWEIDVGVGGAGSEVVIATFCGLTSNAVDTNHHVMLPIPVDAIPSGSRVAVRLRKEGTSINVWSCAVGLYYKPLLGNISTTTLAPLPSQSGSAPATQSSGAAWANPAAFQTIENAPFDLCVGGACIFCGNADTEIEVDLATGGVGSEVVFHTIHKNIQSAQFGFSHWIPFPILYDGIASGTRISFRARASGISATVEIKLLYYRKPLSAARKTSSAGLLGFPSAANGVAPTYATSFAAGTYTEIIPSAPSRLQLVGVTMDKDGTAGTDECEVDIATGSSGNEQVIATFRYAHQAALMGAGVPWALPIPVDNIANNARISARVRTSGVTNNPTSRLSILAYSGLTGQASTTNKILKSLPSRAAGITLNPSALDWTDIAWVECTPRLSNDSLIAGVGIFSGSGGSQEARFELDIGFGAAGSEVVATTLRGMIYNKDFGYYLLQTALFAPQGTRISFRMRKAVTATNNAWKFALMYYDNVNISGGGSGGGGGNSRPAPPVGTVTILLGNVIYGTPARSVNIEYLSTGAAILEGSLDAENWITLDTAPGAGMRLVNGVVAPYIRPSADITVVFRKTKAKL